MRLPWHPTARLPGCAVLAFAFPLACGGQAEYVEPPAPEVGVAAPERRMVTDYIEMTGSVRAIETVEIRARVEGFLDEIAFEEGDIVEKGTLLYRIDPDEYQARAAQAKAALDTAMAARSLAKATLQRRDEAFKTGAVSELEVIESRARYDATVAEVQSAQAALRRANLDLGYTEVTAPITGRVGRTRVDPGNLVGAGEKTLLTTIVRYDPIYAYFNISERALLRLAESTGGQVREADAGSQIQLLRQVPVELGRANDDGYPFEGNLHFTDQGVDPETGTYQLRAIFDNPRPVKLLPGLFVRGRIPLREREGLLVSERALGSDQSGKYVLVVDDENVAQHRPVEIGVAVEGQRVIEKGLEEGDRVIVEGLLRARPGAHVTPKRDGPPVDVAAPPGR